MRINAVFVAVCLALVACGSNTTTGETQADANLAAGSPDAGAIPPADAPRAPPGDASQNPDVSAVVATIDADRDGRMSHAEWTAAGAPESSFNSLDETRRGYVTKQDMDRRAAPPGIDLNGDGWLTLEEFKEFDRKSSARPRPAV